MENARERKRMYEKEIGEIEDNEDMTYVEYKNLVK